MTIVGSEKGAALVTALMLTVLALVISTTLLYSVTAGTRISASQKRYRSALAAAHGGIDVLGDEIITALFRLDPRANEDQLQQYRSQLQDGFSTINLQLPQFDCLRQKIDTRTAEWSACSAAQVSADPGQSPDATFRLAGELPGSGFRVATKIVDTVPGNSDKSGVDLLDAGGSVSARDEIIHPRHVPALYSLSIRGEREAGAASEKATLSVLYAY